MARLRRVGSTGSVRHIRVDCVRVVIPGAPNENIVQNHLNIALLNVF